jgi:hypothetical protein
LSSRGCRCWFARLTPAAVSGHLSHVQTFRRRLIALTLTALVAAGNAAVCEGWASTPEARMDCCTGDHPCPMHPTESDRSGATRVVTQAQADSCCALSEQEQAGQSSQPFAAPVSSAVLGPGIVVAPAPPRLVVTDTWRTGAPVPSPPVSMHVLLAVFLL